MARDGVDGHGRCGETECGVVPARDGGIEARLDVNNAHTFIIDVVSGMGQDLEGAHEVHGIHARMQCE